MSATRRAPRARSGGSSSARRWVEFVANNGRALSPISGKNGVDLSGGLAMLLVLAVSFFIVFFKVIVLNDVLPRLRLVYI